MPAEPHRPPETRPASAVSPPRLDAVRVAVSTAGDAVSAVAEIAAALGDHADLEFLLLFVSSQFDAEEIAAALFRAFPDLPHAGCSTAGEITPRGLIDGGLVAIGFRAGEFRIACEPLRDLGRFGLEQGGELVADLRGRLFEADATASFDLFALTLLDGLCQREEVILSALVFLGLGTRFAAVGLLVMTAVVQLTVPDGWRDYHLPWAAMLMALMVIGPGAISLDRLIAWRWKA